MTPCAEVAPPERPKFIHDTHRIVLVNLAGCALFRCEADALVDLDMMELLVDPGFRGLARLRMTLLREHKQAPPIRYQYRRCDGTIFWASVTSRSLGEGLFESTLFYEGEQ